MGGRPVAAAAGCGDAAVLLDESAFRLAMNADLAATTKLVARAVFFSLSLGKLWKSERSRSEKAKRSRLDIRHAVRRRRRPKARAQAEGINSFIAETNKLQAAIEAKLRVAA